VNVEKHIQCSA